jgi:hypothetical protein
MSTRAQIRYDGYVGIPVLKMINLFVCFSLKPDHSCILVFQFSATLPTQNENRPKPEND